MTLEERREKLEKTLEWCLLEFIEGGKLKKTIKHYQAGVTRIKEAEDVRDKVLARLEKLDKEVAGDNNKETRI